MMYKINDVCEIEKNPDDDDYLVLLGEDMLIVNQSAGEILEYIKKAPTTKENLIFFLIEKYSLSQDDIADVINIIDDFRSKNIICEIGK